MSYTFKTVNTSLFTASPLNPSLSHNTLHCKSTPPITGSTHYESTASPFLLCSKVNLLRRSMISGSLACWTGPLSPENTLTNNRTDFQKSNFCLSRGWMSTTWQPAPLFSLDCLVRRPLYCLGTIPIVPRLPRPHFCLVSFPHLRNSVLRR